MSIATTKRNFYAEVDAVLAEVFAEHRDDELSRDEIYNYAIASGRIDEAILDGVRDKAVKDYFMDRLRRTTFLDEHGAKVRTYQSYQNFRQREDGREVQLDLWKNIHTMSRAEMTRCYRARIVLADEVRASANTDLRYWDQQVAPQLGVEPLQRQLGL